MKFQKISFIKIFSVILTLQYIPDAVPGSHKIRFLIESGIKRPPDDALGFKITAAALPVPDTVGTQQHLSDPSSNRRYFIHWKPGILRDP